MLKNILKLVKFDMKKVLGIKKMLFLFGIFTVCAIAYSQVLENNDLDNWKSKAAEQQKIFSEAASTIKEDTELLDETDKYLNESFEYLDNKVQFCLENNILYGVQSVWTFIYNARFLLGGIIILQIILSGNCISIEKESKMWEKINVNEKSIGKVFLSKVLTVFGYTVIFSGVAYLILGIVGAVLFGKGQYYFVAEEIGNVCTKINCFDSMLGYGVAFLIVCLFYSFCSILLETLFSSQRIVSVMMVVAYLFNGAIINIAEKIHLAEILPFSYLNLNSYVEGFHGKNFIFNMAYLILANIILVLVSYIVLKKKRIGQHYRSNS